jgi:hypothetical protein
MLIKDEIKKFSNVARIPLITMDGTSILKTNWYLAICKTRMFFFWSINELKICLFAVLEMKI